MRYMPIEIKSREIQIVPLKDIKLNPKNRNKHPPEQLERLAEILRYQGFRVPGVISNRTGYLMAGEGRYLAAKLAGFDSMPVIYQDFESEEQEYAFGVSDNAVASWAELDLAGINSEVGNLGPDFDLDMLGIKDFVLEPADKYEDKDADDVPESRETRIQVGDVYSLGNHRLMCGDSTKAEDVAVLMNGEKADMVFTDPPYNHGSKDSLVASPVRRAMQQLKDSAWDKDFNIDETLKTIDGLRANDCTVYICTSHHIAGKIFAWQDIAAQQGGYVVWVKPNPMPSLMKRHWTWDHELICYSTYGKHTFNFPLEGHAPASWIVPKNQKNDLHPTMKPVEIPERAITHSSKQGDVVWDGFLGSGSTLIACEKTNRKCYGMEIDPQYCQVIIDRWEKFTGQKAVKISSGDA